MLRIEHFTKSYGKGKPAVEDLNLHVHPGDIFALSRIPFPARRSCAISPTTRTCTGI